MNWAEEREEKRTRRKTSIWGEIQSDSFRQLLFSLTCWLTCGLTCWLSLPYSHLTYPWPLPESLEAVYCAFLRDFHSPSQPIEQTVCLFYILPSVQVRALSSKSGMEFDWRPQARTDRTEAKDSGQRDLVSPSEPEWAHLLIHPQKWIAHSLLFARQLYLSLKLTYLLGHQGCDDTLIELLCCFFSLSLSLSLNKQSWIFCLNRCGTSWRCLLCCRRFIIDRPTDEWILLWRFYFRFWCVLSLSPSLPGNWTRLRFSFLSQFWGQQSHTLLWLFIEGFKVLIPFFSNSLPVSLSRHVVSADTLCWNNRQICRRAPTATGRENWKAHFRIELPAREFVLTLASP